MSIIPSVTPIYSKWLSISEEEKEKILLKLGYTKNQITNMSDKEKWNSYYKFTIDSKVPLILN